MITKIERFLFIMAILVGWSCSSETNNAELWGYDYQLFEDTPVWELAQAVQKQDAHEITRVVSEGEVDINYQEPRFGHTLLMLTVANQHFISCKALLVSGADPNKHDTYNGSTALIEAAGIANRGDDNTAFLRLLLAHGADPNEAETGSRLPGSTARRSPLIAACHDVAAGASPIEKVKILVEAGADVNYENEFGHFALRETMIFKHYDVVLYLLQKGANYEKMLFDRGKFQDGGKKVYIADHMREHLFPLGSKEHASKMQVVDFLKTKGIDYRKVPIPEHVIQEAKTDYPGNWPDYLEKY